LASSVATAEDAEGPTVPIVGKIKWEGIEVLD
jgi:hypothetical protein